MFVFFQHLHYHATAKKKTRLGSLFSPSGRINKDSFQLPINTSPSRVRPEQQDYLGYANAVCVCSCLLTEITQNVFSNRRCAHFLSLGRSWASVCHVRSETGGERSGGRMMKTSFIQAGRESVKNTIQSDNTEIIWQQCVLNQQSPLTLNVTTTVVLKDVLQLFLLGRHGYMITVFLEKCWKRVFLLPAVSERPCRPPNNGSLSVSSWLLPPPSGSRPESGCSVSSRQSWRRIGCKNEPETFLQLSPKISDGHIEIVWAIKKKKKIYSKNVTFLEGFVMFLPVQMF